MAKLKYQIVKAEKIFVKGVGVYDNNNLTNEIAEYLLSLGAAYQDVIIPLETETKKSKKKNANKEQDSQVD